MRMEQLSYVQTVAQCGSMNLASEQLHVSQQAISKAIRQLENELGIAIFVRTNKGVVLTPQGQRLYDFARRQAAKLEALQARLAEEQQRLMTGEVTLATMNTGANMILPHMLCEFYRHYSGVRLTITDGMMGEVIDQVLGGQVQLGIITYTLLGDTYYPQLPEALEFVPLLKGENIFWVSRLSKLAERKVLDFAEVAAQPILFYDLMDHIVLQRTYGYFGFQPQIALESKNLYLLGQLTAENYGVLPDMRLNGDEGMYEYVFRNQPATVAVPLKEYPTYQSYVGYIRRRDQEETTLLRHVRDFLGRLSKSRACRKEEG